MKSNTFSWVRIPFQVLHAQNVLNLQEDEKEHFNVLVRKGVPFDHLVQANKDYSQYYRLSSIYKARLKAARGETLDEKEKEIAGLNGAYMAGMEWTCYWTGVKLVWRQSAISSEHNGDSSLPYARKNSTALRYARRGAQL